MNENDPHPFEPQWEWLQNLPGGTRVIAKGGTWIKPKREGRSAYDVYFVNVDTGEWMHYSFLADYEKPVRQESYPSLFSPIKENGKG